MSLRRELLVSFGVQGAGAASVLLATVWLGASLGPEVQGGFSRAKSEIEFVAAFAMFGLPQALFFHVRSGGLNLRDAQRWVLRMAALALPIGVAYALLQHARAGGLALALLTAAVVAGAAYGPLRALLLVRERTEWFNVLTALPQWLVLAGVAVVIAGAVQSASIEWTWYALFAIAYAGAATLAWHGLKAVADGPEVSRVGWRELGHYGLAAWLTAALSTAAMLASQRWVEAAEGRAVLGQFTLAMTLVQVPLTPVSYAAPLLLRRWIERPGGRAARRWAGILFALLLGVAAGVWLLAPLRPDLGLGPAYTGATRALAVLLAGAAAEAASRLLTVQASARGRPWIAVRAEAARWGVLAAGWLLPLPHGLLPWCAVWAAAAGAAALVIVLHAGARDDAQQAARCRALRCSGRRIRSTCSAGPTRSRSAGMRCA